MSHSYRYLHTSAGVTVVVDGKPYAISAESRNYREVLDAIERGTDPLQLLEVIEGDARRVQRAVNAQLTESLAYSEGVVYYHGKPLHNPAVRRLLQMVNQGEQISALANFIEKQQRNPDSVVHEHLYTFLEYGKIPLTADGDFLTYKAVRGDYRDIHSGTFDNSVGQRPRLPGRTAVDPDRHQTCSYGLHVCSYAYLPHFASAQGHVMICKVNPEDVVAIPSDYNNTKMRVIGYEVVGEVTTYYREGKDELGGGRLVRDSDYEVWYEGGGAIPDIYDTFFTLDEAKQQANALAQNGHRAWVEHARSDEVLYTA